MDGNASTNSTNRRPVQAGRPAQAGRASARIAGPLLGLLLAVPLVTAVAAPAQAATAAGAAAGTAGAGATWARLMHRKLDLAADAARLTTLLPGMRATVVARNAVVTQAQRDLVASATTVATAATADQSARTRQTAARTAAAAAKKTFLAEQKRRPADKTRVARAKLALTTAEATVRARTATVAQTTEAARTARTAYTTAADELVTATVAAQAAAGVVAGAQQRIAAQPAQDAALAAQAAALSQQVVTETRASFTATSTTPVYGVTVNKILAYPFQRMIDDAARAGIQLSGGGFRTRQQQIALRTANGCPDVWTAPASSCRVPTAIPGRSLHELGLAIDISSGKKSITDRKSPAFTWLAANAARYGLVNLPAEPWHWSITGS